MSRDCDRLSKARHRALESESEALLRKEHDRASKAKKRALEPESEGCTLWFYVVVLASCIYTLCLHYNEQERHCKRVKPPFTLTPRFYRLWTRYYGHNFVNAGEVCTLELFRFP